MPGTLFVVATPIGNLEDLTFRALRTLREVDLIAAEDTRRTSKLLAHYDIRKPLVSVREYNETREAPRIVARIAAGESVALVTDAGTPGIADPGRRLVAAVNEAGLKVVPIPGPSAVAAALSVCGLDATPFIFHGFPPRSGKAREDWLRSVTDAPEAQVFFEAPHRIRRTLTELRLKSVKRPISIHREISKIHESLVLSPNILALDIEAVPEVGEFVVVVGPRQADEPLELDQSLAFSLHQALVGDGRIEEELATVMVARYLRVEEVVVKKSIKKSKILVKQQIK